jgi:hypothetical protein
VLTTCTRRPCSSVVKTSMDSMSDSPRRPQAQLVSRRVARGTTFVPSRVCVNVAGAAPARLLLRRAFGRTHRSARRRESERGGRSPDCAAWFARW